MIILRKFRDNIGLDQIKHHEQRMKDYLKMSSEEKEKFREELEKNKKQTELNRLGRKTDKDIREAVKGTKAEKKVDKILDKSTKEMKEAAQKSYSKQDREVVPDDIVKKVKEGGGVIQKDHNGDWRIISMKTKTNKSGKAEFWPSKFKTKAQAKQQLEAYNCNKHK